MIVSVRSYPQGPRVWVADQRIHHGATGCILLALAARRNRLVALAALAMVAHDRRDWRVWFVREHLPLTPPQPVV